MLMTNTVNAVLNKASLHLADYERNPTLTAPQLAAVMRDYRMLTAVVVDLALMIEDRLGSSGAATITEDKPAETHETPSGGGQYL